MKMAHDALVMVVDGGKMLLFRNAGDEEFPNLQVEEAVEQNNPSDAEQGTDRPGRSFAGAAGSQERSAMSETDFHQQAEDRFAAEAVDLLNRRAMAGEFDQLVIVAAPNTLGEMRQHYHKTLKDRLAGEIGKTLTGHPVDEIEKIILNS
ncbi:MAG: host attachment family protein [Alphaproteobacteria bacterium]|nr:host attachment family protein [Alphaproteobacteria bacterium]MBU0795336.1 host attachment family protein [Alphaproteobacteria bacterium]MBU0877456.1 host attachment family protein [Alphaproteobacteria bacterium]MBU1770323.1 host attachment family protein [Alphaproteobacteria bacterium]